MEREPTPPVSGGPGVEMSINFASSESRDTDKTDNTANIYSLPVPSYVYQARSCPRRNRLTASTRSGRTFHHQDCRTRPRKQRGCRRSSAQHALSRTVAVGARSSVKESEGVLTCTDSRFSYYIRIKQIRRGPTGREAAHSDHARRVRPVCVLHRA